uniref:Uncharacterized protein n=1 Tax=Heliothis virescens TaxID=7102 RepID=A0A2A4IUW6_HELVI
MSRIFTPLQVLTEPGRDPSETLQLRGLYAFLYFIKMKRMPFVVVLVCLLLGPAHSWDIATTFGNRIDFFTNNTKTHSIAGAHLKNITASAYDALHDTLLFVDQQTDN